MIVCARIAFLISICELVQAKLETAVILFRHGDRTPTWSYPSDAYKETDWPNGYGQLTSKGIEQLVTLGSRLRDRYARALKLNLTSYDRKMIRVRSTDYDRTLMSAHSFLSGLYAPNNVPVPIHTVERRRDYLLFDSPFCPRYEALFRDAFKGPEARSLEANMSDILSRLETWTLAGPMDILMANRVWDTLFIESLYDRLPSWAKTNWAEISTEMFKIRWAAFKLTLLTEEMVKLRASQMLREVLNHMQADEKNRVKLLVYSGHDSTLCAMLAALGSLNKRPPPGYGGSILLELDVKGREKMISASYSEHVNDNYSRLDVPCGVAGQFKPKCRLEDFFSSVENLVLTPEELKRSCQMKSFLYDSKLLTALQVSCLIVLSTATAFLLARALITRRKSK